MKDPNIVDTAPNVCDVIGRVAGPADRLADRARGVMLGQAVGNLLGLAVEGCLASTRFARATPTASATSTRAR